MADPQHFVFARVEEFTHLAFASAVEIMRAHLEDTVSLSAIAREIGISTRQLERLFGRYLNTAPKKYFMKSRLEKARHLLLQTKMSVTDVALACGFDNPGNFSRACRTAFGVAPMMQRGKLG